MNNQVLSIEQMQELIELEIDTSKASCYWMEHDNLDRGYIYSLHIGYCSKMGGDCIPAFTLQDILEMLPTHIEVERKDMFGEEDNFWYELDINFEEKSISYHDFLHDVTLVDFDYDNLLDGAFNMLKWCKQNNYI